MWFLAVSVFVLALAALVVSYPLVFGALERHQAASPVNAEYPEQDALLEALADLDLAHQVGKLSDHDYRKHKLQLEKQYLRAAGGEGS